MRDVTWQPARNSTYISTGRQPPLQTPVLSSQSSTQFRAGRAQHKDHHGRASRSPGRPGRRLLGHGGGALRLGGLLAHLDGLRLLLLRWRGRVLTSGGGVVVPVAVLVVGEDGGVACAAAPQVAEPGELGQGGAQAGVAVGAVGRDGAPGDPLGEAVEGEAVGDGLAGEVEVDEAAGGEKEEEC